MYVWFDALNIYQTGIGFDLIQKNLIHGPDRIAW